MSSRRCPGPVLVTVIAAVNPVPQLLLTVYATAQDADWACAAGMASAASVEPATAEAATALQQRRRERWNLADTTGLTGVSFRPCECGSRGPLSHMAGMRWRWPGRPLADWGQLQVVPLRAKLVGEVSSAAQVPWKPIEVLAPGLIVPS